jgi:hypothetical protein
MSVALPPDGAGQCRHWVQIEAGERFVELVNTFLSR